MDVANLAAALADRYPIQRSIGKGGMAEVFLARDPKHNRDVALKVLLPRVADSLAARFAREIEICARLTHPNILPLLDSGEVEGLPYYITPYLPGASLRERLQREPRLPIPEAVRIATDVANALQYAHESGVLHRDIKPGNILLSSGRAVVADFGIAHAVALAGGDALTRHGFVVGTPIYMSPEQSSGEVNLTGASDVYSLASVTYEMLTGNPPFERGSFGATLAAKLSQPPPEPRALRPEVPEFLNTAVHRGLATAPEDRFESAAAFADVLTTHVQERSSIRSLAAIVATVAVTLVLLLMLTQLRGRESLDPHAVVVFPLIEADGGQRTGEGIAGLLGYVLDDTEPLRWIEGWYLLDSAQRESARVVELSDTRALTIGAGAAHFLTGRILLSEDSVTVLLNLHEARSGEVVERAGASGVKGTEPAALALSAVPRLILPLLEPGQTVDPGILADRSAPALVNFYLGEGEYRRGAFDAAVEHYFRAVAQDTTLALAALRGAEAAMWSKRLPEARAAADLAARHPQGLPGPYVPFAEGLHQLFRGSVDIAIAALREHVSLRPASTPGWAALGEAHLHHFPQVANPDSLALHYFDRALSLDSQFVPAAYHAVELLALQGEREEARARWRAVPVESVTPAVRAHIDAVLACTAAGADAAPSEALRALPPDGRLGIGFVLATGEVGTPCALEVLDALVADDTAEDRYYGLQVLGSILVGSGRVDEAHERTSKAVVWSDDAPFLHLLWDIASGVASPAGTRLAETMRAGEFAEDRAPLLWLAGVWEALLGRPEALRSYRLRLEALPTVDRVTQRSLVASLRALEAAASGDEDVAITRLGALGTSVPVDELQWRFWHAYYPEKRLLRSLLRKNQSGGPSTDAVTRLDLRYPRAAVSAAFLNRSRDQTDGD